MDYVRKDLFNDLKKQRNIWCILCCVFILLFLAEWLWRGGQLEIIKAQKIQVVQIGPHGEADILKTAPDAVNYAETIDYLSNAISKIFTLVYSDFLTKESIKKYGEKVRPFFDRRFFKIWYQNLLKSDFLRALIKKRAYIISYVPPTSIELKRSDKGYILARCKVVRSIKTAKGEVSESLYYRLTLIKGQRIMGNEHGLYIVKFKEE